MADPFIRPDPLAASAAAATEQLAQLQVDYLKSPTGQAETARAQLMRVASDPNKLAEARALQATIDRAEKQAQAEPVALSDEARLNLAIEGIVERGPELTWGSQISSRDLTAAVQDDLELGLREELIRNFYATGRSGGPDSRETEIKLAEEWKERLLADPEMQRRLFAKDPEIMKQFRAYGMYAASREEAAA
jgi:hypothetical protein